MLFIDQIVVPFCYSARTREGVQLAFEELVEKVHVDHNVYKHVMQCKQNVVLIFLILFDYELNLC